MTLNGNAVSPLYVQLMEDLEAKICDGTFAPGERLLSENEMAKRYGVSIITVRKAALALEEKGLVEKRQGKGTFVIGEENRARLDCGVEGFHESIRKNGRSTS